MMPDVPGLAAYASGFLAMALVSGIACLGLNLQWGQTGLFNVGVAGFMAIGAYVSALLTTLPVEGRLGGCGWPLAGGWLGAALAAGAASTLVGAATLRLRADTLAITTFGVGVVVQLLARNVQHVTGGVFGIGDIPRPFESLAARPVAFELCTLALVAGLLLIVYMGLETLARSPWGRVLRAIREDERAACALGKNPSWYRLQAFAIGGAIMGLAGALQAHLVGFIAPDNFEANLTFQIWTMLIIGGSGNNRGAVLGSVLVAMIWSATGLATGALFPAEDQARAATLRIVAIGVLLAATIVLRPRGLIGERLAVSRHLARVLIACLLAGAAAFPSRALASPPVSPESDPPAGHSPLEVQLDSGPVRGRQLDARIWLGIPYAAPPVGTQRWRAPAPVARWSGVRAAGEPGQVCAQPTTDSSGVTTVAGSEDCLTLNVYAPKGTSTTALPVMVWIHGGAQMYGTGISYDGSRLAERQQLIVVTVNYRLGPFGWFHHPAITHAAEQATSGQFGLLDLIAALRWVHRNIAAFGGDPGNVTIFGESAGAQNVYALMLTPAAKGLFHKAIAESGGFWNMTVDQAVNFADAAIPGTALSAREVVNRLLIANGRAANPTDARRLQRSHAAGLAPWLRALPTAAVLSPYMGQAHAEDDFPSVVYDGMLIPRSDPRHRFEHGDYNTVPMIVGGNRDEEKAFLSTDESMVRESDGHIDIRAPARYAALNRYYSRWWNFMAVDDLVPRLRSPVFAYRFDWDDEPTEPSNLQAIFGAAHGIELAFVFGCFSYEFIHDEIPEADPPASQRTPLHAIFSDATRETRERLSDAMMAYWAEFARTGDPSNGARHELPAWHSWRTSKTKLIFGSFAPREQAGLIDGNELLRSLWKDTDLTPGDKCAMFLESTMYPSYRLGDLTARHCRR